MEEKKKVGSESQSDQDGKVEHESQLNKNDPPTELSDNNIQEKEQSEIVNEEPELSASDTLKNSSTDLNTEKKTENEDKPIASTISENQHDSAPSTQNYSDVENDKGSIDREDSNEQSPSLNEENQSNLSSEIGEEETPISEDEEKPTSEDKQALVSKDQETQSTKETSSPDEVSTHEPVTNSKEETTSSSSKDDRLFNTMEFKAFDQWKVDEVKESLEKGKNEQSLPDPSQPSKQTPKQNNQVKSADDSKRKKLIGGIVAASFLVVGSVVAYTFNPFSSGSQAVAEVPKPQPAIFQLALDDEKYELDLYQIGYDGKDLATIDELKLRTWLDDVKKKVDQPAEDAKLKWFGKEITPEKSGRKMDVKAVEAWLTDLKPLLNKPQQIPIIPIEPLITAEDLRQVDQKLLGKYNTKFDGSNVNRTTNIRLSSKAIDNLILMPGEEFSFNKVVGQRTTERGYKSAGVIVRGEFSEDIGGGICQVSSTLFNSVDEAGLKITRVQHHSAEVTYVPPGRDATVSWGGPDFRFKNSLNKPVLIKVNVGSNTMTVSTYTVPGAKKYKPEKEEQPESFVPVEENKDQKENEKASTEKK